jgi:hypothetical protein
MALRASCSRILPVFAGVLLLFGPRAAAQPSSGETPSIRVDSLTAGLSAGVKVPYDDPDASNFRLVASGQIGLTPRFRIEAEYFAPTRGTSSITYSDERLDRPFVRNDVWRIEERVQGAGLGAAWEFGNGRFRPSIGGGVLVEHVRNRLDTVSTCLPREPGACAGVDLTPTRSESTTVEVHAQFVPGLSVRLSDRLIAHGAVRIDDGVTPIGGVRVVLLRRSPTPRVESGPSAAPAQAGMAPVPPGQPEVHVTLASGERHRGRLIALSSSQVVLRQAGGEVTFRLAEVRRVERVTHRVRNAVLIGALAGYVGGYLASCGSGDEEDCWPEIGLLVAGIGAGAGAIAGLGMNASARREGREVIYVAPGQGAALAVAPIWSAGSRGVAMAVTW